MLSFRSTIIFSCVLPYYYLRSKQTNKQKNLSISWFPFFLHRETFQYAILALSIICTWLGFLYPVINAFVLLAIGVPFVFMLFAELKR